MMKKTALSLFTVSVLAFSSCSESSSEYHSFAMPYPVGSDIQYYADQEKDSLVIQSTDSWRITQENGAWISFSQESLTLKPGFYAQQIVQMSFSSNTSDEKRVTTAAVTANGRTFRKTFTQLPYLNIIRPNLIEQDEMPTFELTDSAHVTTDSIKFVVHAQKCEIKSNASWLIPADTIVERSIDTNRPRHYTCDLRLIPNTTSEERKGELTLSTSNGCSTVIKVRQLPKKEKP